METQQLCKLFLVLVTAFYIICIYQSQQYSLKVKGVTSPSTRYQIVDMYQGLRMLTLETDHSRVHRYHTVLVQT